ncbi:MAG: DUF1249 domain-containing protein [Candidatus Thiodiazotropha sp.]
MIKSPEYPWSIKRLFSAQPTVGMVLDLSEENYRLLMRMAPDLTVMSGRAQSCLEQGMDLHLEILEQTPYTSLIHMTYYFSHSVGDYPDPDAELRVYHDSRQVDVVALRQSALPLEKWGRNPTVLQRWRINLFLSKWLQFCLESGHRFSLEKCVPDDCVALGEIP